MGIPKEVSTWLRGLAWGRDPAEVFSEELKLN